MPGRWVARRACHRDTRSDAGFQEGLSDALLVELESMTAVGNRTDIEEHFDLVKSQQVYDRVQVTVAVPDGVDSLGFGHCCPILVVYKQYYTRTEDLHLGLFKGLVDGILEKPLASASTTG